jgi:hypothetical protein
VLFIIGIEFIFLHFWFGKMLILTIAVSANIRFFFQKILRSDLATQPAMKITLKIHLINYSFDVLNNTAQQNCKNSKSACWFSLACPVFFALFKPLALVVGKILDKSYS